MNTSHYLLVVLWVAYCIIHSLLADANIKSRIQKIMGSAMLYYRPLYSIFAAITLALLLWYQIYIPSQYVFYTTAFLYIAGIFIAVIGLVMMTICINKYFYELSGLQAIQQAEIKNTLQQSGLHRYVRHPLYLGTLLFIWGLFFIFPLISNLIAITIITAYVLFGISLEEKKLHLEYGELYKKYSQKVPKLIPRIIHIKKGSV